MAPELQPLQQLIALGLDARALYLDIERGIYPETPITEAPPPVDTTVFEQCALF